MNTSVVEEGGGGSRGSEYLHWREKGEGITQMINLPGREELGEWGEQSGWDQDWRERQG